jgi:hypothetical protein
VKLFALNRTAASAAKPIVEYVKANRQRSIAIAVAVTVGAAGLAAMQLSNAATYVVALEAESGSVGGKAAKSSTDPSGASNGAVYFGSATFGGGNPTTPPPTTPPPTTPPPTTGTRASGMPWSSGVWGRQETGIGEQYIAKTVSSVRGGVPIDNVMHYTVRATHAAQISSVTRMGGAALPAGFNASRDDLIVSVTTWAGDGSYMNASQAGQVGAEACKIDSSPIIRLNWEMNLPGGPAHNGEQLTSGNYSSWVPRFRTAATAMKAACPALKVDFNPNHGADQTGGCGGSPAQWCSRRAFLELKDVIDIFGIDTYDAWASHDVQVNGAGELNESYNFALANGKKFSVPEWGVAKSSYGNGHGDDPSYINMMMDWYNSHASGMAYETYFGEPADYIYSDLVGMNPNSRAAMAAKAKQYSTTH